MKTVFPVVFSSAEEGGFAVYVPDLEINTQGETLAEAIEMARDAIGLVGIDLEDDQKTIPQASALSVIADAYPNDLVNLVDVDFAEYRRKNDIRTVRRNVSLPSWLNVEAERAGLNVSAVLQAALKKELGLSN